MSKQQNNVIKYDFKSKFCTGMHVESYHLLQITQNSAGLSLKLRQILFLLGSDILDPLFGFYSSV